MVSTEEARDGMANIAKAAGKFTICHSRVAEYRSKNFMFSKLLSLFLIFSILSCDAFGEGRAVISFKENFHAKIKEIPKIAKILDCFDIADKGAARTLVGNSVEYIFPFAFLAKLKGDKGGYQYVIVIDSIEAISSFPNTMIAGTARFDPQSIGVSVWPLTEDYIHKLETIFKGHFPIDK